MSAAENKEIIRKFNEAKSLDEMLSLMADDVEGIPDFASLIAGQPDGTAVYCCGPEPMLRAVEEVCAARSSGRLALKKGSIAPMGKSTSTSL